MAGPGINQRFNRVADATSSTPSPLVVTWSSNEPTASLTQTIANGTIPTVAELGQYAANNQAVVDTLVADLAALEADVAALRSAQND